MKFAFTTLETTRKNTWKLIEATDKEQWTTIPEGFSNHLFWNACHMLVTQQLLNYKLAKLTPLVPQEFIDRYRKGTEPSDTFLGDDFDILKEFWIPSVQQLETDFGSGAFWDYSSYETSYGVTLASIEDAITFNNVHEALHYGVMRSISKFV